MNGQDLLLDDTPCRGSAIVKIEDFRFRGSFGRPDDLPRDGIPEIAFFGRSNVGKSSVINTLFGVRNAAYTSKTPGRTGNANYFLVNNRFYFVDVPGYGYAKVSKQDRERWVDLLEGYLAREGNPRGIVLILDVRHLPSVNDQMMVESLSSLRKRFCLVFNKIDKIKRGARGKRITENLEKFDVEGEIGLIPFSCITGEGKRELLAWISETIMLPG